ncbi:Calx-beta domain-containing protein [Marinobacterium arenosum]|uniref:Calx-beta domain-containing protein n=1 Tax=Marinobacterium arenosum TaxID=2862496 RepID=UPI001C939FB3|nr:Calx-beta domain-containing protein [Marinobacterium arenosum]MBY4679060.1 M10 family metallopeptidase C-terminal domain-containing protein [Marinobacterium arenosum]
MTNSIVSSSGDYRVDSLLIGVKWGSGDVGTGTTLSYSYPTDGSLWYYSSNDEANAGWYGLSSAQQQDFDSALNAWAEVANINLSQVTDGSGYGEYGDIRVAYTYAISGAVAAYAYTPGNGTYIFNQGVSPSDEAGDIWINPEVSDLGIGSQGYATLLHEIGHALGLKHTFDAEGEFPALNAAEDDTHYSLMSYTDYLGAGYLFEEQDGFYSYTARAASTPMLYDILAIQYLYGANTSTRTGDDTYSFATDAELKAIWDAGGTDTFDLSNQLTGVNLNLTAGSFSDIGQKQMEYQGAKTLAEDNIAIAFNVEIENAIGSAYDDSLTGNALDNQLTGGAGNDSLDGGAGTDTAVFSGNRSAYTITGTTDNASVSGQDGTDSLTAIENLQFDDGSYSLASLLAQGEGVPPPTQKSEVDFSPTEGSLAYFLLELSGPLSSAASVSYSTRDGTAIAGEDYVATSGTAFIAAGETYTTIAVELIDDSLQEGDETFSLAVFAPVGGVFGDSQVELVAQRTITDNDTVV